MEVDCVQPLQKRNSNNSSFEMTVDGEVFYHIVQPTAMVRYLNGCQSPMGKLINSRPKTRQKGRFDVSSG